MCNAKSSNIADNPSVQRISRLIPLAKFARTMSGVAIRLGLGGESMKRIHESSTSALEQVDILELADRFNSEFAKDGWIATSSLSAEVMRQALANTEAGKPDQADKTILEWFTEDRIRLFAIQASRPFNKARGRVDQLEEALTLTMERRYMAAVPLILIACDGLASDVLGTSPFEKNADLRVFDSVVGHSTALPALIGTLAKGIRVSRRTKH